MLNTPLSMTWLPAVPNETELAAAQCSQTRMQARDLRRRRIGAGIQAKCMAIGMSGDRKCRLQRMTGSFGCYTNGRTVPCMPHSCFDGCIV